jgi:hypothetical protein
MYAKDTDLTEDKLECHIAAFPLASWKMKHYIVSCDTGKEAWHFPFTPQLPRQGCTYLHNYKQASGKDL